MEAPLLETKLHVPRWRPGLVPRRRLIERLERGTASRLTLVSAPAGFGKTTLLAEWLATATADAPRVAWLSLDASDSHPPSFWTYLITALQTVQPGLGAGAIALLQSSQPPAIETPLAGLLNEVDAVSNDVVLVLDDYHVIDARPIHDGIAFLLDHLPPRLHLVIASRADPPLPLARLRGRGELLEIRAVDLRFTPDEAAAFLNEVMGLHLAAPDVAALEARTEGWIAGLKLAALSMQGRDDIAGFTAGFDLQQGEQLGNSASLPATPYRRCLARARLRRTLGDLVGAIELLEQAEGLRVRGAVPDSRPIAALKVRVQLAQGKLTEALDWTREQGLTVSDELDYLREFQHITLARVLIAESMREREVGGIRKVDRLLERLLEAAEAGGRTAAAIEILVLRAIAQRGLGDIPAALAHLERALALAEPESYVRVFVDEGDAMHDLLRHAATAGISGSYVRRLLFAFGEPRLSVAVAAEVASAGLAEPLTAREVEIMRLVASGMKNQESADQLVINLPTVKRHIANAYGKLGVGHRTEAVARANELGVL